MSVDDEFCTRAVPKALARYGHTWESGDGWGVVIGVSRCQNCNTLARSGHFTHDTCGRLGIDVEKWAQEIRAKVAAADVEPVFDEPGGPDYAACPDGCGNDCCIPVADADERS